VVTKSGANQFHGSLFEFFQNEDLDANSFMQNLYGGGKQEILRKNQFGGTFGGPVKKDKLFFFGSYQGTRQLNGVATQGSSSTVLPPIPARRPVRAASFMDPAKSTLIYRRLRRRRLPNGKRCNFVRNSSTSRTTRSLATPTWRRTPVRPVSESSAQPALIRVWSSSL